MRILFVTHVLPYPPTDGGRMTTFNAIRHLSRDHDVFLASLVTPAEAELARPLRDYCSDIALVPSSRWRRYPRAVRGMLADPPGTASLYFDRSLAQQIGRLVDRYVPDLVVLEHLNTAVYRAHIPKIPVVLREHNAEFKVWERHAACASGAIARRMLLACAHRVRHYEAAAVQQCARCVAISDADAALLRGIAPAAPLVTVPAGIDCAYFSPAKESLVDPLSMVTVGSFAWKPKQHNLEALATRIFPRIRAALPGAALTVVGKGVPPRLRRLAESQGITVTGEVPDTRPYLRRAALVLNYVEVGGGMALKVLEAMAMRKAVLSNPLGCTGLALVPGRDLCVAASPGEYAAAAVRLLHDAAERERFAAAGHLRATAEYSCEVIGARYDDLYREVAAERHPAPQLLPQPA